MSRSRPAHARTLLALCLLGSGLVSGWAAVRDAVSTPTLPGPDSACAGTHWTTATVGGRVLAFGASASGRVTARDPAGGPASWSHLAAPWRAGRSADGATHAWPVPGAPLVHRQRVFYVCGVWPSLGIAAGALDAVTGEPLWHRTTLGWLKRDGGGFDAFLPVGGPRLEADRILLDGVTGTIELDPETGALRRFTTRAPGGAPVPLPVDGWPLGVVSRRHVALAGMPRALRAMPRRGGGNGVPAPRTLIVETTAGLHRLELGTEPFPTEQARSELVWRAPAPAPRSWAWALDGAGRLVIAGETGLFRIADDGLRALSTATLHEAWPGTGALTWRHLETGDGYVLALGEQERAPARAGRLLRLDPGGGAVSWFRPLRDPSPERLAVGHQRVFAVEPAADARTSPTRLSARDLRTGEELWSTTFTQRDATLRYAERFDILVVGLPGPKGRLAAFHGQSGSRAWSSAAPDLARVALRETVVLAERSDGSGFACNLSTGEPHRSEHPLTGEPRPLRWEAGAASPLDRGMDPLLARLGAVTTPGGRFALWREGEAQILAELRPSTVTEVWSRLDAEPSTEPIRTVGLNFGAPGDRFDESGLPWIGIDADRGEVPGLRVEWRGDATTFTRRHAAWSRAPRLPWVAASGLLGATTLTLRLEDDLDGDLPYTVRLILDRAATLPAIRLQRETTRPVEADPPAGRRNEHGYRYLEFGHVRVDETLTVEIAHDPTTTPVLCGLALLAEW